MNSKTILRRDHELVQIVDAALADSVKRSGDWLACRIGCTQCCVGVFAISQLDAFRLREGLAALERQDPERAQRIKDRVHESVERLRVNFPGDAATGILDPAPDAFEEFGNYEVCPVLHPESGQCDLYSSRPMTCRVFGPPVRSQEGLGVCELCFQGANNEEIAACELRLTTEDLEAELSSRIEEVTGKHGETIVAFALNQ